VWAYAAERARHADIATFEEAADAAFLIVE